MMTQFAPVSGEEQAYFTNAVTRLTLANDSTLHHAYVQEQGSSAVHVDSVLANVQGSARYEVQAVASGAKISRLNMGVSP